jgi:glycosyltransferase involved in cell wall biosynthesis
MQEVINAHHLALFLSKTEGYPNALLDYIFSKIPIIASDIPMVKAVGQSNIQYYELGKVEQLERQILYALENYDLISLKCRDLYSWKLEKNNITFAANKLLTILD